MNTRQLQYALELSKSLNFSQVAEKLGISQPALSKQILHLEQELNIKLFDRSTSPLTVTPAGEHFFREAEKLLYQEDQLLRSMAEFQSGKRGRLTIGISPFRSLYLMPRILTKMREKYPDVQISLQELGSERLRKETAEGKFDFSIVNLPVEEELFEVTPLEADTLVLAVPAALADGLPEQKGEVLPHVDLKQCEGLPFVMVGQTQEMRQLFEKSCVSAGITPRIVVETVGISTAWAMCKEGLGATLVPLQFIRNAGFGKEVRLFTLQQQLRSRQPVIITKKGQYVSEYAAYAIALLSEE